MAVISYKCPNCGGGLTFDTESQKLACEYCMSEFTEEEMRRLAEEEVKASGKMPEAGPNAAEFENGSSPAESTDAADAADSREGLPGGSAVVYNCPSCGAEIVTEATTAATFCYYCHNPIVLSGRLSGEYLPDHVIPFAIDQKQAKERFIAWIGKKKYVPESFYSKDQIEKLSGVYFPYLMYSCQADGRIRGEGEKQNSYTRGNTRFTEHKQFRIEREGTLDVKNLSRHALSKSNRELIESVLPYETEKQVPFHTGYLSGFMAEKRDMDSDALTPEAEQEVRDYTIQNLTSGLSGYHSYKIHEKDVRIRNAKWQYALLPVWVLTYKHQGDGKLYYFAMNGQTGKICGKLPVDRTKLLKLFGSIFLPMFAALMIGGWFL